MEHDYVIVSAADDDYWPCAWGCGCSSGSYDGTHQLLDGSLITVYGYNLPMPGSGFYDNRIQYAVGVVRWRLPALPTS